MCRDDGFFVLADSVKDGRDEVGQAFADACAGLDDEVLAAFQRLGHGDGHLLLFRAKLKILRLRQQAACGKKLLDHDDQIQPTTLLFIGETNHFCDLSVRRVSLYFQFPPSPHSFSLREKVVAGRMRVKPWLFFEPFTV